jgi:hypothetical protein
MSIRNLLLHNHRIAPDLSYQCPASPLAEISARRDLRRAAFTVADED